MNDKLKGWLNDQLANSSDDEERQIIEELMENEDKYKLALFAVIRNSKVMPAGLQLGKSMKEINRMARDTVEEIIKMCDFKALAEFYEDGNAEK